jgi:EmrB/QacA subfamily drug resistance transporter
MDVMHRGTEKRFQEACVSNKIKESLPLSGGKTAGKWTVLGIVAIGVFMATLDASIVNISLPKISNSFNVPLNGMVEWVIVSYLVVIASLLLTLGRLADMFGRKLLWVAGLGIFTASSALCGMSPSLLLLVVFRAIQGVGGAMIMANSPAMVTSAFPSEERGRALGTIGAIVAIGLSAGPTVGGIITEVFSWRGIFYINLPIGIVGIFATLRLLPEKMHLTSSEQQFDPLGATLLSLGLTCLMLGMTFGQEMGWRSAIIIGLFTTAVTLLAVFIIHEGHVSHPIVDLSLFRIRLFSAALVSSFLSFLALSAVMFLMPFYLQELLSFPTHKAGLILSTVPVTISFVAPLSGWLSDRFGSRVLSSLGLAIGSIGLWFLSNLTARASVLDILWPLVVTGFGQALFQSPNNSAIMGSVLPNRLGIASGFLATVRVLGQGFSVALAGAIFTSLDGSQAGALLRHKGTLAIGPLEDTFVHAFHMALFTCMIIAAIGVITSLLRGHAR